MKGYRGGMFKGNETVNRYEMAIIVSRLMKKAGGKGVGADVRRTMDRLGEEFMDELDLIGARLTALENAFHEHVTEGGDTGANGFAFSGETRVRWENRTEDLAAAVPAAKDDRSRFQTRTLLNVEKSVDRADFFVQLQHDKTFRCCSLLVLTRQLDLNQAWVKLAVTDNSSLKLGRQELNVVMVQFLDDMITYKIQIVLKVGYSVLVMMTFPTVYSLCVQQMITCWTDTDHHGLDLNFTDIFEGDLHVHYYHSTGLNGAVGDTLRYLRF